MGVRSMPVEGERGSFSSPTRLFLMAGSGFTCAHAAILLSLDPMTLIKRELAHRKHKNRTQFSKQSKTVKRNHKIYTQNHPSIEQHTGGKIADTILKDFLAICE